MTAHTADPASALLTLAASLHGQDLAPEEALAGLREALGLAEVRLVRLETLATELDVSHEWLRELRHRAQFAPYFHQVGVRGVIQVQAGPLKEEICRCPAVARKQS